MGDRQALRELYDRCAPASRALVDLRSGKGMVLSGALAAPSGKDFQLWVIRGKAAPFPAGLLRSGPSGAVLASIDPGAMQGGAVVLVGALPKS